MSKRRNVKNLQSGKEQGRESLGAIRTSLNEAIESDSVEQIGIKTDLFLRYKYIAKGKTRPAWHAKPNWRYPMLVAVFTKAPKTKLVSYITGRFQNWRASDKSKFESELYRQAQPGEPFRLLLKGKTMRLAVKKLNIDCADRIAFSSQLKIVNVDLEEIKIGFSGVQLFDTVYEGQTKLSTLQNQIALLANKAIQGQKHTFTNTKVIPKIYNRELKEMEKIFNRYGGEVIESDKIYQSMARLCQLAGYYDEEIPNSVGLCRTIIEESKAAAKELNDKKFLLSLRSLNNHFIDSGVLRLTEHEDVKTVILFVEFRYLPKQKAE